jgi:hypothetical protein
MAVVSGIFVGLGMIPTILRSYLPDLEHYSLHPIGSGLIHRTWKVVVSEEQAYVLQQVNTDVFRDPGAIAANLEKIGDYLHAHHREYLFAAPLRAAGGDLFYRDPEGDCYRLFPYIPNSRTFDVVDTPVQAYEAARQFALFTRILSGLDTKELKYALPDFHDLALRYRQFGQALREGNPERIHRSRDLIDFLEGQQDLVGVFEALRRDPAFSLRVTHHDTKISNVLFDGSDNGLCVIDLDTVMPGYFISDTGDMIRTYVALAGEEETNLDKIVVREDFFQAIAAGYLGVMGDVLSTAEKEHFFYSGLFLVYMQSLRFLTDYLNDDIYYGARYEGHNFNRATNQAVLLQRLLEKEAALKRLVP